MNEALERIVNLRPSASALVNHYLKKKKSHIKSRTPFYLSRISLCAHDNPT